MFSITDYVIFLQPLTTKVRDTGDALDRMCLSYVLGTAVRTEQARRGRRLAKLLPFETRRQSQRVTTVSHLYGRTIHCGCTDHDRHAWDMIATYSMARPLIRVAPLPCTAELLDAWMKMQIRMFEAAAWHEHKVFRRRITLGSRLPPLFRARRSPTIERQAIRWYLNRLRGCPALSAATPRLHVLMGAQSLNEQEIEEA